MYMLGSNFSGYFLINRTPNLVISLTSNTPSDRPPTQSHCVLERDTTWNAPCKAGSNITPSISTSTKAMAPHKNPLAKSPRTAACIPERMLNMSVICEKATVAKVIVWAASTEVWAPML